MEKGVLGNVDFFISFFLNNNFMRIYMLGGSLLVLGYFSCFICVCFDRVFRLRFFFIASCKYSFVAFREETVVLWKISSFLKNGEIVIVVFFL